MERYDAVIIGAGLVGAALAFDLSCLGVRVLVLEMGSEIGAGASRTNSGILHTGFDSKPGQLETALIRAQAQRWPEVSKQLKIPYKIPGAILLAKNAVELRQLEGIAHNAALNEVEVKQLSKSKASALEPNLAAEGGLLVPGEAMTDPLALMRGLLNGIAVRLGTRVQAIEDRGEWLEVIAPQFRVQAPFVINCAGLFGDQFFDDSGFQIVPRRGEFLVFPQECSGLINRIILPIPNNFTKGILAFSTLYGYLIVGPTAENQADKTDWTPHSAGLQTLWNKAAELFPTLADIRPIDAWAGLRPHGEPQTYRLEFSPTVPNLLHLAAIRSTGLSACLGISQYAVQMLRERGLNTSSTSLHSPPVVPYTLTTPWWTQHNALHRVANQALVESLHAPRN